MIDQETLNSWYEHKSNKEQWIEDEEIKQEADEERNLENLLDDRIN